MAKFGEKFVTAEQIRIESSGELDIVEVYVNPYEEEIKKHLPFGARGWISPFFDLYFEGYDKPGFSKVPHSQLLTIIFKESPELFPNKKYLRSFYDEEFIGNPHKYGVTIQRDGKTNNIYVGESASNGGDYYLLKVKAFIEEAQQKHPTWKITPDSIRVANSENNQYGNLNARWGYLGKVTREESLKEKFFGADKAKGIVIEIYKNPTSNEVQRHVPNGARGYIDGGGNLYLEGYDNKRQFSIAVHSALLSIIYTVDSEIFPYDYPSSFNEYGNKILKYGLTVQRVGDTNEIRIGESAHPHMGQTYELFSIASKVNPQWNFVPESIFDVKNFELFSDLQIDEKDFAKDEDYMEKVQQRVYALIKNSTTLDQKTFNEQSKDWIFYGDSAGGVALKEMNGYYKFVSMFGHQRSIVKALKEVRKDKIPIWGELDHDPYLESQGFITPPLPVMNFFKERLQTKKEVIGNSIFFENIIKVMRERGIQIPTITEKWLLTIKKGK
jgi:hypothetical protein